MKISNRNNLAFGSKNSPIEQFVVHTQEGPLSVAEAKNKDAGKLARMFVENESARFNYLTYQWEHPEEYKSYLELDKIQWRKDTKEHYLDIMNRNDGNMTILTAKDKKENLKGIFQLKTFDDFKSFGFADSRTGYLEKGFLDYKFRRNGVEQIILYKLSEASKGIFTDIITTLNIDGNIYKGVGFELVDMSNSKIKSIMDRMKKYKITDSSEHLISKAIDNKTPWWKRVAKQLK